MNNVELNELKIRKIGYAKWVECLSSKTLRMYFCSIYIYIFIMKLPLYIGGANRRGVGGASNYSY